MKKSILIFLLFGAGSAFAQPADLSVSLKDIEMPASPGFVLLDQAPSCIERPASTKAFVFSILNSIVESEGLPENYAIEITPFWYFKHRNMSALKYAGIQENKQLPFSELKLVSLSAAYINLMDTITILPVNNISFGARTTLFKIRSETNSSSIKKANAGAVDQLRKIDEIIVKRIGPWDPVDPEGHKKKQAALLEFLQDSLKITNNLAEALEVKPVFVIDFAVAYNLFFTNNDFSTKQFGRFGTWVTLNYAQKLNEENTNYLNLYAIGRYLKDEATRDESGEFIGKTFYDFGAKVELQFNKFSFGYEYIYRSGNVSNTFRSSGQLKYRISDNLFLTGAFGKNFGDSHNLVSMLGINWGLMTGNEKAVIK
jgi:hypothetical protein